MERAEALINKLKEQFEQNANRDAMLMTAKMLVNELQQKPDESNYSTKKVSVIMPAQYANATANAGKKIVVIPEQKAKEPEINLVQPAMEKEQIKEAIEDEIKKPELKEDTESDKRFEAYLPKAGRPQHNWMFDGLQEVPTLAQQQKVVYELKENGEENSINNKLRENKNEVGDVLQDAPIKDLKKAIGINDRFLFINELFRGDETMYERSIKTINTFSILPEAAYWIQRELKLKLAWNENSETVVQFDQLVKRRFS